LSEVDEASTASEVEETVEVVSVDEVTGYTPVPVSLPVEIVSAAVSDSGEEVALSVVVEASELPVDDGPTDKLSEKVEVSDALETSSVVEMVVVVEVSSSVEGPGDSVIVGPVTVEVAPGDAEGSEISCDVVSVTP
jgi:hypothetical protein